MIDTFIDTPLLTVIYNYLKYSKKQSLGEGDILKKFDENGTFLIDSLFSKLL